MNIFCDHGFYTFAPESMDDRAYFEASTGYKLTPYKAGFTFPALAELGPISIAGQPYGGLTAKVNYCGAPADVMRANGFVFDLKKQKLSDISDIKINVELYPQVNDGMIAVYDLPQAGAAYNFNRLISFAGVTRFNNQQFVLRTYELKDPGF